MRRHHGRPTRRLPLEPDPRTPIRLTLPRWLSTRIRTRQSQPQDRARLRQAAAPPARRRRRPPSLDRQRARGRLPHGPARRPGRALTAGLSCGTPSRPERPLSPIRMCRKRPFAIHRRGRRPARAAVCRIPCLILCLADVQQSSAGGTAFRADGCQRNLGPCHQSKRGQTIDVVSMNDAVYACAHKGCSGPQAGLQGHTISPAPVKNEVPLAIQASKRHRRVFTHGIEVSSRIRQ